MPVSIDINGNLIDNGPRNTNHRPRYMPGHLLAIDVARGGKTLFGAPGTIFSLRRDALVKAGGYRQPVEYMQMYGIVPFGVTGFDETAISYWRHHEGQLNREATSRGLIGAIETFSLLKDWQIKRRWQVLGGDMGKELVAAIEKEQCAKAASWMTIYLVKGRLRAAIRLTRTMWSHPQFWVRTTPKVLRAVFSIEPIRLGLRLIIRSGFRIIPGLANLSPGIAKLRERVNK
jgi:hypothetical protein